MNYLYGEIKSIYAGYILYQNKFSGKSIQNKLKIRKINYLYGEIKSTYNFFFLVIYF